MENCKMHLKTFSAAMTLAGLGIILLSCQLQNSCMELNNNKLNSSQKHNIAQNCRIAHRVVQRLPQHDFIFSQHKQISKRGQTKQ
jgi:hypothetical protein